MPRMARTERLKRLDLRPSLGPICGFLLVACWLPMGAIILRFPDLDDVADIVSYWAELGTLTQIVIALTVAGYPFLLVFLAELKERWTSESPAQRRVAMATYTGGLMFFTCLNVALGLGSAGGQLSANPAHHELAFALHVAGWVLAAPAAGLGTTFGAGLVYAAWTKALSPGWLTWPALIMLISNAGALGGLFALTGPWNSGNGILGGIALPLGSVVIFVACASTAWIRHQ